MKDIVERIHMTEANRPIEERPLYHYNCAEALLMAANEKYNLGLDDRIIKAACPFGGGMQSERTCGALTGALNVLGIMLVEDRPSTNAKMKEKTKELIEEFIEKFGSIDCASIKKIHRTEAEGCLRVKMGAAELFESVVKNDGIL